MSAAEKAGLAGWLEGWRGQERGENTAVLETGETSHRPGAWSAYWTVEWLSGDVSCQRCLDLIETNLSMIYIIIVVLNQSGRHHANSGNVS